MSKDKIQLLSPLFLKYQADYEKNPRSRVFAPLAETYRKLGMTDKAMEILSQGIRFHPTYIMGYLGLAFCYFDLRQFTLAYNTLRPIVEMSRDNIRLQKLFGDICMELGYKEEALETFKYLLFINPRDKEVALQVSALEKSLEERYRPVHQPIFIPESEFKSDQDEKVEIPLFNVDKLENRPKSNQADFDDWMAVDLSREQKPIISNDPYEFWNLKKGDTHLDLSKDGMEVPPVVKLVEPSRNEAYPELFLNYDDDEEEGLESDYTATENTPLVTHTLVDLYCGQGHIEKALEVLEKILLLNPSDEKTIKKIAEINSLMGTYLGDEDRQNQQYNEPIFSQSPQLEFLKETSEEDGRKNLMEFYDQQVGQVEVEPLAVIDNENAAIKRRVEEKLTNFLKKIQKRALDYQARV